MYGKVSYLSPRGAIILRLFHVEQSQESHRMFHVELKEFYERQEQKIDHDVHEGKQGRRPLVIFGLLFG